MTPRKPQRIRDPVHDLIEFGTTTEADQRQLEQTLWGVMQTRPFQRLRRIKQLGFSELVFPGATHTRFAHSVGVFHTARQLMGAIRKSLAKSGRDFDAQQARVALAAALVHDLGHGMFSHAFERFGEHYKLSMAQHEAVSDRLIRGEEIREAFRPQGKSFADEVADIVKAKQPGNLYAAVVSSQFDADRLDYMQRDRLMTGVQSSDVDATWLIENLEVGPVNASGEDGDTGSIETLILGDKALQTAESYVVSVLHLYQNVYGHKATRAAEIVFFALLCRIMELHEADDAPASGLPASHPILRFIAAPEDLERVLDLDDTVLWGALPMMAEAADARLRVLAVRLRDRRIPPCVDIRRMVVEKLPPGRGETAAARRARLARIMLICKNVVSAIEDEQASTPLAMRDVLVDEYERPPYRQFDSGRTPMNQIHIRQGKEVLDVAQLSSIVAGAEPFQLCRAYDFSEDSSGQRMIENIMRTELQGNQHGDA